MINLLNLNKLILVTIFIFFSFFNKVFSNEPVDIWEGEDSENISNEEIQNESETENLILIDTNKESDILISEEKVEEKNTVVGLFDPEKNNFTLSMWQASDGLEIKKIIKRINKLNLSNFSENLFFEILFTNSYEPKKNLTADEFLDIKINWLIKNEKVVELENLLKTNPEVGKHPKPIKFLVEEYLSSADIASACEKVRFINKDVQNNYLEKFNIYCLIYEDRKNEAQLVFDLLKERGFKDSFFENKINFLFGFTESTNQKILDNDLFNFYLSQVTNKNFSYQPSENTSKYIWRYLASANLIKIENFDDEETITTFEKAASLDTFEKKEIFNIYKNIIFNVNQLLIAGEIYKTLPRYKARALIYQKILLTDNIEKKLFFTFLLKDLFKSDNLLNVYSEELPTILKSIDKNDIPESYTELVQENSQKKLINTKNIKFENDVIHKSKILKHFLEENYNLKKTEKNIKSVYKKVKRNKKYFISIKDIIVFESLQTDGFELPRDLNFDELSSKMTIPEGLNDLAEQKQIGLVMLKIVEIIGEDNVEDLDPETIYFINKILNKLGLKKIRNNVLSLVLPTRV